MLAQWLDNDESGDPDNAAVVEALVSERATVTMWPTDDGYEEACGRARPRACMFIYGPIYVRLYRDRLKDGYGV